MVEPPVCSSVLGTVWGLRRSRLRPPSGAGSERTLQKEHWTRSQRTKGLFCCPGCGYSPHASTGLGLSFLVCERGETAEVCGL